METSYLPIFDDLDIRCTANVAAATVTIDRERFGDALTSLLEVIAGAEAGQIHLQMKPGLQDVRLLVIADGHHDEVLRDARQWQPFLRKFARCGSQLSRETTGAGVVYQIVLTMAAHSLSK